MIIGVLKEGNHEKRVALLPEVVKNLKDLKCTVYVESGAGHAAFAPDEHYKNAGAEVKQRDEVLQQSDVVLCIHSLPVGEVLKMRKNGVVLGIFLPLYNYDLMKAYAAEGLTAFSLDMIPRTTRAQSMDVLSSQANIAGYKAVITAAYHYPHLYPMLTTAAGSIAPAKVLILGAGVAGLQAIATAKRLGAVVEVFDTRPAVKEEVKSLGAKFIEVEGAADASKAGGYAVEQTEEYKQKQKAKIAESVAKADVVISTAQIPGKRAPVLVTKEMVQQMRPGSVIIDLASATGGNCELTADNQVISQHGVTIVGQSNLQGTVPADASKVLGKNYLNFLKLIISPEGQLALNMEDDLVVGTCITHQGNVTNSHVAELIQSKELIQAQ